MRINDLLYEFAPAQPSDDELDQQVAQQNPEEPSEVEPQVQQTPPVATNNQPPVQAPEKIIINPLEHKANFAKHLSSLIGKTKDAPNDNPLKIWVSKVLHAMNLANDVEIDETSNPESQTNRALVHNVTTATIEVQFERLSRINPEKAQQFWEMVKQADEMYGPITNEPGLKKAMTAAIKGIQLNAKGEILLKNKQIRDLADEKAEALGMEPKWARNLIGMFDLSITPEDQELFLLRCNEGTALRIGPDGSGEKNMIEMRRGKLEDVVSKTPPSIKDVFNSIKGTLLDISLSTGQGAATGPFEAMLCIMGNAKKGISGDVVVPIGGVEKKFEVKSCSIDKTLSKVSGGWMDAPKPTPPADVKNMFATAMGKRAIQPGSDFGTKKGLTPLMTTFLAIRDKNTRLSILMNFHKLMFPNIANVKGYDFAGQNAKLLDAILSQDYETIGKIQGGMGMVEYAVGSGNDGFIFYNSSFQEFLVVYGIEEIINCALHPEKFGISPTTPIKMIAGGAGTTRRGTPGLYFGHTLNSKEGEEYKQKVKADPAWQKWKKQKDQMASQKRKKDTLLETIDSLILKYF